MPEYNGFVTNFLSLDEKSRFSTIGKKRSELGKLSLKTK
jgi:hypothetical protein